MLRPLRYGLRVTIACALWIVSAAASVFWSMVVLAALSPAVVVGAFIGERLTGEVAERVQRPLDDRAAARSEDPAA